MANEIEDTYNRIISLPNVVGFMVITMDGIAVKSTLEPGQTLKYAGQIAPLVDKARKMIREFVVDEEENTDDEVTFMRLRTKHHEVLVAPDGDYVMIVIQLPHPVVAEQEGEEGEKETKAVEAEPDY